MQKFVVDECNLVGKDLFLYQFLEFIGKGSFGCVYKVIFYVMNQLVVVKIINIEEGDSLDLKMVDIYSDLLKEINVFKFLWDSGVKNINYVMEVVFVGQFMWVIMEYCVGGSVVMFMKFMVLDGFQERWIIFILCEVVEVMKWVYGVGIIYRDFKCVNVLVIEVGDVQFCDFGVVGVVEIKFDKWMIVIGILYWMVFELFDNIVLYGMEVDIWVFGVMVFEMVLGFLFNVVVRIMVDWLGSYLKLYIFCLDGDQYFVGFKDFVFFCLYNDFRK